ncbi:uncharacterized protein LOC127700694 [Mytilus californianus]|uniref:uncharacterized protein LOC127700694 n=1 Tax=Mytilus californianus TaxID=6549 RepID=UPI0022469529|nr:uncharacterized protein LOC127700694 [Mytilus californianus]
MKLILPCCLVALLVLEYVQGAPSLPKATVKNTGPSCPRYPVRYEEDSLVIEIEKGECEMVIASVNMHEKNADKVKSFRKRVKAVLRKVNMPTVSFRSLMTISEVGSSRTPSDGTSDNAVPGSQTSKKSKITVINPDIGLPNPGQEVANKCTKTNYRFVGPVLIIDTVPGDCQMMIVAHGKRKNKVFKRLNKKGKPIRPRKKIMFEYIDEQFF